MKYCTDCYKPFHSESHRKCAACDKTSRFISGAMRCKPGEQACTRCFQPRALSMFEGEGGTTTTCESCRLSISTHKQRRANREFSALMARIPAFNLNPRWAA